MNNEFTQTGGTLADELAADCGAGDLAAAAAIDAEEGDAFLQTLLADQMAAAHLLTMRMAAAADRAIGAAADSASQGGDDQPLWQRRVLPARPLVSTAVIAGACRR